MGAIVAFGTTDAQGQWCSSDGLLAPGAASVIETPQPGWVSTDPGGALPKKTMTLVAGQTWNGAFGNWVPGPPPPPPPSPLGMICVVKYNDLNGDGVAGPGEPGMAGWQFTIPGPSGPITLTTAASGWACTPMILPVGASYVVTETPQPGWASTFPGGATPQRTITVYDAAHCGNCAAGFLNRQVALPQLALSGQICVTKYQDLNRNGQRDAAEPLLAGFTFEARDASGVVVATGVTDAQGSWCSATSLPPGAYKVFEVPKPWWVSTDPAGPPMDPPPYYKSVTLAAAVGAPKLLFDNIKSGQACVHKYNDLNGNGRRDPGEPPLAGWVFKFDYTSWDTVFSVRITTDASGTACVDLPPGPTQQVIEIPQPGWTHTDPPGGWVSGSSVYTSRQFTIVEGQTTDLLFGNHSNTQPPSPPGVICVDKYNDLDHNGTRGSGETGLPGWVFNLKTPGGAAVGSLTTNALGHACIELSAGAYAAFEAMQGGWSNSDPPGAGPHKPFTVVSNQTVNLVFGNYQRKPGPPPQECPKDQQIPGDGCCPNGTTWSNPARACVAPPPPQECPKDRQIPGDGCCRIGTTYSSRTHECVVPFKPDTVVPLRCPSDSIATPVGCVCKPGTAGPPGSCKPTTKLPTKEPDNPGQLPKGFPRPLPSPEIK